MLQTTAEYVWQTACVDIHVVKARKIQPQGAGYEQLQRNEGVGHNNQIQMAKG